MKREPALLSGGSQNRNDAMKMIPPLKIGETLFCSATPVVLQARRDQFRSFATVIDAQTVAEDAMLLSKSLVWEFTKETGWIVIKKV